VTQKSIWTLAISGITGGRSYYALRFFFKKGCEERSAIGYVWQVTSNKHHLSINHASNQPSKRILIFFTLTKNPAPRTRLLFFKCLSFNLPQHSEGFLMPYTSSAYRLTCGISSHITIYCSSLHSDFFETKIERKIDFYRKVSYN
jgi:hypothetical protein